MDFESLKKAITPLLVDLADPENVRQIQRLLTDPEERTSSRPWQVNRYTCQSLADIQEIWDLVAQAILPHLLHADPNHRLAFALLLQYAPSVVATETLLKCLGDPDIKVQLASVNALAEAGAPELVDAVLPRLHSEEPAVRLNAVAALGRVGAVEAYSQLLDVLEHDTDPRVQRWAALALGEVDPSAALDVLMDQLQAPALPDEVWAGVKAGLIAIGPSVVPRLLELIGSVDPIIRVRAVETLEPFRSWQVDSSLQSALECDDMPTQLAAAWVLASHNKPEGFVRLREELVSSSSDHRLTAARYMTMLGMVTGLRDLAAAYFDPKRLAKVREAITLFPRSERSEFAYFVETESDPGRARAFCDMAGVIGATAAVSPLLQRVQDTDPLVAITAATSLIRIHGTDMRAPLEEVLHRFKNPMERTQVVRSLRQLWRPLPLQACETLIGDPCAGVIIIGLELLSLHPDPEAIDWIATVLETEYQRREGELPGYDGEQNDPIFGRTSLIGQLVATGESVRDTLPPLLREPMRLMERDGWSTPSIAVAQVAMSALAAREARWCLPVIEQFLEDKHPLLRFRALDTCVALAGSHALVMASDLQTDPNPVVRYWWKRKQSEQLH